MLLHDKMENSWRDFVSELDRLRIAAQLSEQQYRLNEAIKHRHSGDFALKQGYHVDEPPYDQSDAQVSYQSRRTTEF